MAAELYELSNGTITVKMTNFGATITSLLVPDANGDEFLTLFPSRSSSLPHKGFVFFSDVITRSWFFCSVLMGFRQSRGCGAWFRYRRAVSSYPGDLSVTAKYSLPSSTSLKLEMEAVPLNKATPVNLAQHTYWNLAGHNSGNILDHTIQIRASHLTPVDKNLIPTGEIMPVSGTCFDFTTEKKIGSRIHELQVGYDHNYVLDCGEERSGLKHAAKVKDPSSSRVLDLWTDAPGMQFYTGNYVDGIVGKGSAVYGKHAALCLETQGFPNAINQPNFPSVVVQPGEKHKHTMLFEFSTD
ncbi:hypothetical protein BHM03_00018382 [Ensete ventricosum]|nr:hypothetical protein BHM03_00018382 [Ensete ventricosum]